MSKKDEIIDQAFSLYEYWYAGVPQNERDRAMIGLFEELKEYDPERISKIHKEVREEK